MFDLIANTLTLTASVALPTFLSYKALQATTTTPTTSPPRLHTPTEPSAPLLLLSPWLTYWIVNSLLLSTHTVLSPILSYIPLYAWLRLAAHTYLLIPGTAERIYQQHIRPPLRRHEREIEAFISNSHDRIKAQSYDVIRNAVEWVRTVVLGEQKGDAEAEAAAAAAAAAQGDGSASYVQTLLARFSVASNAQASGAAAWAGATSGMGGGAVGAQTQQVVWDIVDKVRAQVFAAGGEVRGASTPSSSPPSAFTSAASSTTTDMKKSKSETEFEKIEREDVRGAAAGGSLSGSGHASSAASDKAATWGSWLFGGTGHAGSRGHKHGHGHGHAKSKDE